jgi:hypothetical protein
VCVCVCEIAFEDEPKKGITSRRQLRSPRGQKDEVEESDLVYGHTPHYPYPEVNPFERNELPDISLIFIDILPKRRDRIRPGFLCASQKKKDIHTHIIKHTEPSPFDVSVQHDRHSPSNTSSSIFSLKTSQDSQLNSFLLNPRPRHSCSERSVLLILLHELIVSSVITQYNPPLFILSLSLSLSLPRNSVCNNCVKLQAIHT